MSTQSPVDPSFAYVDASEEQLKQLWLAYYPSGSGPLGIMRTVCALIESIAHMRGFNPENWHRSE